MIKIAEVGWKLLLLGGMTLTGPLRAMDKLPTASCQDLENLQLLRQCDPYAVHLLRVDPEALGMRPIHHRLPLGKKNLPEALPFHSEWRLGFQKLVDKYIDYKESLLSRREMLREEARKSRERNTTPPLRKRAKNPVKKARKKVKNVAKEEGETLAKYFGNRESVGRMIPLEKRTAPYPPALIPIAKVPEITQIRHVGPRAPVLHIVEPGETFSGLAQLYQTTVFDIRRWNKIPLNHLLKIGEKLIIHPGVKTPPDQIREALRREKFGHYTVKKGDSLIGIARRFGVKKREILLLNPLKRGSRIGIGRKLMLPLSQKKIDAILAREKKKRFKYATDRRFKHRIRVVATAYTSHRGQTDRTPFLAAWNNRIRPGMKIIAVSLDLIWKYRITNGVRVRISGLPGLYTVRDKMNKRLRNHIDIYMGISRRKALRWGRRSVVLYW